ncbi:C22orf23 [Bugula neritina]|uniref:C22orf23 n=1 Tax=Bugula neritina TaxID=10212 RepID=A0A7J7ISA3_BUGNE|nr:C22orf23 [Bugula neritina]
MATSKNGRVQNGGFWNSQQANYSPATQQLLKNMMQESKLNSFQQRQLNSRVSSGQSLPSTCHPTTSAKPRKPAAKPPPPKVLNPRNYSGGVKNKEAIVASGAYERTDYKPRPQVARTQKDKDRLSNLMAYGEDIAPPTSASLQAAREKMWRDQLAGLDDVEADRFEELQKEIEERQNFLEEMITLGQGAKYRPIISTEISQKLREMEIIDQEKSQELEKMIAEQETRGKKRVKS